MIVLIVVFIAFNFHYVRQFLNKPKFLEIYNNIDFSLYKKDGLYSVVPGGKGDVIGTAYAYYINKYKGEEIEIDMEEVRNSFKSQCKDFDCSVDFWYCYILLDQEYKKDINLVMEELLVNTMGKEFERTFFEDDITEGILSRTLPWFLVKEKFNILEEEEKNKVIKRLSSLNISINDIKTKYYIISFLTNNNVLVYNISHGSIFEICEHNPKPREMMLYDDPCLFTKYISILSSCRRNEENLEDFLFQYTDRTYENLTKIHCQWCLYSKLQ